MLVSLHVLVLENLHLHFAFCQSKATLPMSELQKYQLMAIKLIATYKETHLRASSKPITNTGKLEWTSRCKLS